MQGKDRLRWESRGVRIQQSHWQNGDTQLKTRSSQSSFLLLTQPWARSRAIQPIFIHSLAPSSLGGDPREEGQSSRCWHNLCSPWRAEPALMDQTGHQGQVGTKTMVHWVFKTRQEGVFWCRNQKPAQRFGRGVKDKKPEFSQRFVGEFLSQATMSPELKTCRFQTRSCFQPNAGAQKSPGINVPTLS